MPAPNGPVIDALLDRAAAGDATAAGQAVSAFDERLRKVIRLRLDARVARRVGVDDVLQEVHVEALARLPEHVADRAVPLLVWLRFLALQRCVTLARRHLEAGARDARREQALVGGDATSMALEGALAASLTSPSFAAARGEARERLHAAVERLEPADREVLVLRHFEELDNAETASVLGVAPAAASKRYVRALVRLREVLAASGFDTSAGGF